MAEQDMPSTQNTTRVAGSDGTPSQQPHGNPMSDASRDGSSSNSSFQSSSSDAQEGRSLREQAAESARRAAEEAKGTAKEVTGQVTSQAANIADEAVNRVKETADEAIREQRDRATGFVGSIERAVEAAASSLQDDGYGQIANYVRYASSTLQSVNDEVGSFEPQQLTGRAERVVRRNPLVTYGALAVAGFALVSLMNAQERRR